MARTVFEQVIEAFSKAQHILVTFPHTRGVEAIGPALALKLALEKQGKRVDVVVEGFRTPGHARFLPLADKIIRQLAPLSKFIISVKLPPTGLADLSYSVDGQMLSIFLTPRSGALHSQHITTRSANFPYDLIVTVDTRELESLGELFTNNTDFFYATTIVNLDHSPSNEQFGQINAVNFNLSSTSELVYQLVKVLLPKNIDGDTATCLYAGLTAGTKNFTTSQVTPETLALAAELVSLGARREEVVTHLYRVKQLPTLKLWGRALARLKSDSSRKLVWTMLQRDDFTKSGAEAAELGGVVDEILVNAPEARTIVLIYETGLQTTEILLRTSGGYHAAELLKGFAPSGDQHTAHAKLNGMGLLEAEKAVIERLKSVLKTLE